METIEKLWEAACNGDIDTLSNYYERKKDTIPIRYQKFGSEHSLIMGAFRNNQWKAVDYLISVGATITEDEKKEIQTELNRIKYMEILSKNC